MPALVSGGATATSSVELVLFAPLRRRRHPEVETTSLSVVLSCHAIIAVAIILTLGAAPSALGMLRRSLVPDLQTRLDRQRLPGQLGRSPTLFSKARYLSARSEQPRGRFAMASPVITQVCGAAPRMASGVRVEGLLSRGNADLELACLADPCAAHRITWPCFSPRSSRVRSNSSQEPASSGVRLLTRLPTHSLQTAHPQLLITNL
jgi:hypothetical protein